MQKHRRESKIQSEGGRGGREGRGRRQVQRRRHPSIYIYIKKKKKLTKHFQLSGAEEAKDILAPRLKMAAGAAPVAAGRAAAVGGGEGGEGGEGGGKAFEGSIVDY